MLAKLSGPNEFGTANDYRRHVAAETEFPALRQNASATEAWHACKSRMAEREARAILAVSSPETRHSSTYSPVSYYPPYSHRSERGQMHDALASSLSAFLAAPDPAEYLRSKQ
jgi:hypothetical protein